MTNIERLAASLLAGRTVTRATSLVAFKISNITAEIATLRAAGYRITTTRKADDGTGTPYTVWSYAGSTRAGSIAEKQARILRKTTRA